MGGLAGYGYCPGRIALALLMVLAVAGGLIWEAGHTVTAPGHHAAEHTPDSLHPATPCSSPELVGLGIDRGLPLGSTGIRSQCDLDTETRRGQLFTLSTWLVQGLLRHWPSRGARGSSARSRSRSGARPDSAVLRHTARTRRG